MAVTRFGDRLVGTGQPVFIVAEIGYNFDTLEVARKTIDAAVDCGVDAVKFQTFRAETIVRRDAIFPSEAGGGSQFEEFKRYELSEAQHLELFEYARQRGILCFSTPSHYDDVDLLERIGISVYKVGSDDLTNLPFLDFVARKKRPLMLSTGMATMSEVAEAVETVRAAGNEELILLHCVSNYPATDMATLNLRAMKSLARAFDVPVGFSDHTLGTEIALTAVALGATVIEKHFALSKDLPVPDASLSADPMEFRALVEGIRKVEAALGKGSKFPAASEKDMRRDTRKSIMAARPISKGTVITRDMLVIKRPAWGLEPKMLDRVLGRTAQVDLAEEEFVTWDKI
ncbi:MAG: N-acetylneuraminate synthase family protein [Chloroflexi bacterium]|nr:N-acetylneuraminate synthase family protein [Chloroflexota bacterium]